MDGENKRRVGGGSKEVEKGKVIKMVKLRQTYK